MYRTMYTHLCDKEGVVESWIENMIEEDGHQIEEAFTSSRVHCVASLRGSCPSVRPLSQATIGDHIQRTLTTHNN